MNYFTTVTDDCVRVEFTYPAESLAEVYVVAAELADPEYEDDKYERIVSYPPTIRVFVTAGEAEAYRESLDHHYDCRCGVVVARVPERVDPCASRRRA